MRIACALSVAAACVAACGDDGGGQTTSDGAVADSPSGGGAWSTGTAVVQGAIQETAAVGVAG